MFNSNNPFEKPFTLVAFFINPLHMFAERNLKKEAFEYDNKDKIKDLSPVFERRSDVLEVEALQTRIPDSDEANLKKKQIINSYFQNYFSFGFNLNSDNPSIPILSITFIYSVNIAVNPTLRSQFYNHYSGRVPAITQFLLDHLGLGQLTDGNFLQQINLNPIYQYLDNPIGTSCFHIGPLVNQKDSELFWIMCAWFCLLDEHLSDTSFWFNHFVDLKKTPLVSEKPLTLTSFARGYASSSPTVEASPLKDKYVLLNRVLDIRYLTPVGEVPRGIQPYPELDKLSDYPKDTEDKEYIEDENRLATELFRFIASCRLNDLEE